MRNGSDSGNGVARQISRDDNRPRLLLLAAPAAGRTRIDVQQVRDGEQSDDGQKVGHVQALLAAVRNVLFLDRFFRHVEVEFKSVGDGQGGKDKSGGQHDDFLS